MSGNVERAYNEIRQWLLDRTLKPGDPLREQSLAAEIGVSRTPLREALRRLEQEGLIEYIANHGFTVTIWELEELKHLLNIRASIEGYLSRLAVERANEAVVQSLRVLAEEMLREIDEPDPDYAMIADQNSEFHRIILDVSSQPRISRIASTVRDLSFLHRPYITRKLSEIKRSLVQHLDIVSAIEDRDPDLAEAMMKAHILGSWPSLLRAYETQEESVTASNSP